MLPYGVACIYAIVARLSRWVWNKGESYTRVRNYTYIITQLHMTMQSLTCISWIESKPFPCTHAGCDRGYPSKKNLTAHMKIHNGTAPTCDECGKMFDRKSLLQVGRTLRSCCIMIDRSTAYTYIYGWAGMYLITHTYTYTYISTQE